MKICVLEGNSGTNNALKVLVSDITIHQVPGGIDGMTEVTIVSIEGAREIESLNFPIRESLPPIQFNYIILPMNLQQAKEYLEEKFMVEYL